MVAKKALTLPSKLNKPKRCPEGKPKGRIGIFAAG